ncbi:MAG: galactokinase [Caldisericaceae bacterium]
MDLNKLKDSFCKSYGNGPVEVFFAPGRLNLIGEHIDYNGGLVMPAAVSLGIYGVKRERNDSIVRLISRDAPNEVIVDLREDIIYDRNDGWANYPKGVIKKLIESDCLLNGADIMYVSNLPMGAGLSSSAAIEVLTAFMLLYGKSAIDREELAIMCKEVENNFIGVNCGIMDQFAVSMGKKDNAILLDSFTLAYEYIPVLLDGYSLVIMDTNKRRELSDSKYNYRRRECEIAFEKISAKKAIANLCKASIEDVSALNDGILRKRALHVIRENERVKRAAVALKAGDIEGFGRLLVESHVSLRDNFEVTGFYLDTIVEEALKHSGCAGARMTGAGFGGCAIAIVKEDVVTDFERSVGGSYKEKTGLDAKFYIANISDGVNFIGKL